MSEKKSLEKKKFLRELVLNQLKHIQSSRRLLYKDLCRITKYIESSVFDENKCCMWDGYITNAKNAKKGTYINFFFRNKKVALHRLLYENFIGSLGDDYYLKFSCDDGDNKGKCCNVNHMIKYKYNSSPESSSQSSESISSTDDVDTTITNLTISFD
jgi:hypothetical protein